MKVDRYEDGKFGEVGEVLTGPVDIQDGVPVPGGDIELHRVLTIVPPVECEPETEDTMVCTASARGNGGPIFENSDGEEEIVSGMKVDGEVTLTGVKRVETPDTVVEGSSTINVRPSDGIDKCYIDGDALVCGEER